MLICQSCGMPLKQDSDKGTEQNGSLSNEYCHYCYANGSFVGPDCTLEQMQEYARKGMTEKGLPKLLIWFSLKMMPKLKRWAKK